MQRSLRDWPEQPITWFDEDPCLAEESLQMLQDCAEVMLALLTWDYILIQWSPWQIIRFTVAIHNKQLAPRAASQAHFWAISVCLIGCMNPGKSKASLKPSFPWNRQLLAEKMLEATPAYWQAFRNTLHPKLSWVIPWLWLTKDPFTSLLWKKLRWEDQYTLLPPKKASYWAEGLFLLTPDPR